MRKTGIFVITALFAAMMAACGGTAENKPANTTNANTGAAPPVTVAMLKELETKAYEAYKNKDVKFFETFLDQKFESYEKGQRVDRAAVLKMIGEHKDEVKGFTFSEERLTKLGPVTAMLTMKVATDGTRDGKKIPDAISSTLYVRQGTDWRAAWHAEVDYVTPAGQGDRSSSTKSAADDKAKAGDKATDSAKTADKPKTEDKKASEEAPKDAKTADNKAANTSASNSNAAPAADPMTDQLMTREKAGWEAWKAKDWNKLSAMMTTDVMFVDPMGGIMAPRDAVIKGWTDMNCDVKSVSVTDGHGVSVTGDTAILFAKGNADAKCGEMKLEPVWVTAIYLKEGADWKLGYHFEQPAK